MTGRKIVISGTGCALADYLYTNISFDSAGFQKYLSRQAGDGGLNPGKLVFTEELEKFAASTYSSILQEITGNEEPDAFNIGGPGLVPLINASQLLPGAGFIVKFHGGTGSDRTAGLIYDLVRQTSLDTSRFRIISSKPTPFTDVFSDPTYHRGQGERTFVNNIGAAWDYSPGYLEEDFFDASIVCFGGTALVPQIHDNLTDLLEKAKRFNCITVVNTVFDFRNEKRNPGRPWPLGNTEKSLRMIDLLVMDKEEALKISGCWSVDDAIRFFIESGTGAFIITDGANDFHAYSGGKLFEQTDILRMPVSQKVLEDMEKNPHLKGDTTGCGDNFAGGMIASIALQLENASHEHLDLKEALSWAVASGGFTCFYVGGTFLENLPGEKLRKISNLRNEYLLQINNKVT